MKLKNQEHITNNDFLKAYLVIPLSCRSNLAGGHLWLQPRNPFEFFTHLHGFTEDVYELANSLGI